MSIVITPSGDVIQCGGNVAIDTEGTECFCQGPEPLGACCLDIGNTDECVDNITFGDCKALVGLGSWFPGVTCAQVDCTPDPPMLCPFPCVDFCPATVSVIFSGQFQYSADPAITCNVGGSVAVPLFGDPQGTCHHAIGLFPPNPNCMPFANDIVVGVVSASARCFENAEGAFHRAFWSFGATGVPDQPPVDSCIVLGFNQITPTECAAGAYVHTTGGGGVPGCGTGNFQTRWLLVPGSVPTCTVS